MKNIMLFILWGFAFKVQAAEEVINWEDLKPIIQEKNLHVKSAKLSVESAEIYSGHLSRSYYPKITSSLGMESFETGSLSRRTQPYYSLESSVNVYRGGKDALEDDVRSNEAELAKLNEQEVVALELEKARKAFAGILYFNSLLSLLKDEKQQNATFLKGAIQRIKSGVATKTDRIEFEIYGNEIDQRIRKAEVELDNEKNKLAVLLGRENREDFKISQKDFKAIFQTLGHDKVEAHSHRQISFSNVNRKIAELKSDQANRQWWPSLDLYAGYYVYNQREREGEELSQRDEPVVGVRVTFDLFDAKNASTEAQAYSLKAKEYEYQSVQTERELHVEIDNAQKMLKRSLELIKGADDLMQQSDAYLKSTLSEYARGVKNSPDVLEAAKKYSEYRQHRLELERDFQEAAISLLQIMGE